MITSRQHSKHPDWDMVYIKILEKTFDLDWFRQYIKSHDINQCRDEQGNTFLHRIVQLNTQWSVVANMAALLLIDPNIKNNAGQTALQIVQSRQPTCLETLLNYHLCIDFATASTKPNGLDALFAAIYRGDATLGDTSGVTDDGNERNAGRWTALHCAAMYDRPHLIRELHQRFPKLDIVDSKYHGSALHIAAKYGHSNCIIALCECFPTIKAGDALQTACKYNRPACIPTLRKCFPHLTGNEMNTFYHFPSALMCAALINNPECIRALHSYFPNIDPNMLSTNGETALMATADNPICSDCLPILSECFPDIDPNRQNKFGNTALMHACDRGSSNWVTLIRSYFPNIDVNRRNKLGVTALMRAIEAREEKCLVPLCQSFPDIDLNIQDNGGNTALMRAVRKHNFISIACQLQKAPSAANIDPNVQNDKQETVLMRLLTQKYCSVESLSQFFDLFPTVNACIRTAQGETALTFAIKQSNAASIVTLLLERFPDLYPLIDQQRGENTSTGKTAAAALVLAIEKNKLDVLLALLKHISVQLRQD